MITRIEDELKQAMRDKNTVKLNVLRSLKTAITNTKIAKYPGNHDAMPESEVLQIVRKQISQRLDSIEQFVSGQRFDLIAKEESEMAILSDFLPADISDDELNNIIDCSIRVLGATSKKDMGKVIKDVVVTVNGRADNKRISKMVGDKLQ